jgi:hypothetical protein
MSKCWKSLSNTACENWTKAQPLFQTRPSIANWIVGRLYPQNPPFHARLDRLFSARGKTRPKGGHLLGPNCFDTPGA